MGIVIYDDRGIKDINANGTISPLPRIGGHDAVQFEGGIDTCVTSLKVTETSRVDVQGTSGGNEQRSCEIANQVAQLIEPKLPK